MKKVELIDENSSPEARAQRLRRVRNIANLSREQLCADGSINIFTYKGWEIARFGGLPYDGAERIVKQMASAGVVCTVEWLLHGKGAEPYIIPHFPKDKVAQTNTVDPSSVVSNLLTSIHNELLVFQNQYSNGIYSPVVDDGLYPLYAVGDIVAGVRRYDTELSQAVGKNCIVETADRQLLIRYVRAGVSADKFTLCCTNVDTTVSIPILYDVALISAAQIIRHYSTEK